MKTFDKITFRDILHARKRLAPFICRTPTVESLSLQGLSGAPVFLKKEHTQRTGSFKLRGATNAIQSLSAEESVRGVVGVSTGNYGKALAYAARQRGMTCVICMSELVPDNKVEAVKAAGAEVRIIGKSQDEAQHEVDRLVEEEQMIMLPPFDHPEVIAGQGTLGLEILEDIPDAATIIVPLSGGGLAAGLALAAKTLIPAVKIIAVSMERGAAMHASLQANTPVQVEEYQSLADSLGGGIGLQNKYTFPMVRDLVDEVLLVSEEEIAAGICHAYWEEGEIVEGGGAVGIAALLAGKIVAAGPLVIVLSGANIDRSLHHQVTGKTIKHSV